MSLSEHDLMLCVLGASFELALGMRLEVLQLFLCGLEHADWQVAMAYEFVVKLGLFCLD